MSPPLRVVDDRDSVGPTRTPPCNVEAERALLGAILMNNRCLDQVSDFLLPDHFADAANARIFAMAAKIVSNGGTVNPVTLKTYIESDELINAAGGMKYIVGLASGVVTTVNAGEYGKMIHDLYLRRELINMGEAIVARAFDSELADTAEQQIESASGELSDLIGSGREGSFVTLGQSVAAVMRDWQEHDKGNIVGLSTGLKDLDEELGLLQDGDLMVLGGSPGAGKTSLAITMAFHAARHFKQEVAGTKKKPKRAVIFSSEMSHKQLTGRAITTHTTIQNTRRRRGALTQDQWDKIVDFEREVADLPFVIDDREGVTLPYIRSRCRQQQRYGQIGLVVIDYLQIMGGDPSKRAYGKTEEIANNAMGAKYLARMLKCPVILISSLNRKNEDRDNKRPQMADLRGAGDIEYAADIIAFCHREAYYLERSQPEEGSKGFGAWEMNMQKWKDIAEVIIAKSRSAELGTCKLGFQKDRTLFYDLSSREDESDARA